jgi:multidrug efflux pump subunit AcrB
MTADKPNEALVQLAAQMREDIAGVRRARTAAIVVFVLLIALVFGYMTWLNGMVTRYSDEQMLAQVAVNEATKAVTSEESQRKIERLALEGAPRLVNMAADRIEQQIPKASEYAVDVVDEAIAAVFGQFEESLERLDTSLNDRQVDIDKRLGELLEEMENTEALATVLKEELRTNHADLLDEISTTFDEKLTMIDRELKAILLQNPAKLTDWEKDRRMLYMTMIANGQRFMETNPGPLLRQMINSFHKTVTESIAKPAAESMTDEG